MRVVDRLVVLILSLLLVVAGAAAIFVCFDYQGSAVALANAMAGAIVDYRWIVLIGGALVVILGVVLIFASAFHSSREPRVSMVNSAEQGDNLQVSVNAIDCIIQQVVKEYPEISKISTKIRQAEAGIGVTVQTVVNAGTNIPELSARMQKTIQNQLETMVGLKVDHVKIVVSDVMEQPAVAAE